MAAADLTTLAAVNAWLGLTGTNNDAVIKPLISAASVPSSTWQAISASLAMAFAFASRRGGARPPRPRTCRWEPGESGEKPYRAIRLARKSSSQPAALRPPVI